MFAAAFLFPLKDGTPCPPLPLRPSKTTGLNQEIIGGWGESVSCAKPLTTPRYGFYTNAVSVLLLLGGGIISLQKTYASNRELNEAVEMWEKDRAETAEMESRLAMIRKKEEYAAAAGSAAVSSAQSPATIFRSRKPGAAAPGGTTAAAGGASSRRGSGTSEVDSVLPLSPPTPRSPASMKTTSSATTATTAGAAGAPAAAAVGSTERHLSSGRRTNSSVPPAAAMQSPEPELLKGDWDLESGAGGAAVAPGAAGADSGAPGNSGKGAVDDDLPPPQGWEVRNTPSGDK